MRDYLVYTAGPMGDLSYDEAAKWRQTFANGMPKNIVCMSPMRYYKPYFEDGRLIESRDEVPLLTSKGVMARDRFDVMRADLVVVNLLKQKCISKGTMMELGWADAWRKPIVLITEHDSEYAQHPMIKEAAGFIVPSVKDAIIISQQILLA